jgi:ABC-2 type transport system permease protein
MTSPAVTTNSITTRPSPLAPTGVLVKNVSQTRVIKSEWMKLRSLRSTRWSLLAAFLIVVGLGILICAARAGHINNESPHDQRNFDATGTSLAGSFLAQLAIGTLGVLLITGEYSTGMVRATFGAVPKRLPVLWGKAIVYAVVSFVTMLIAAFLAFFGGQAAFSGKHFDTSISSKSLEASISDPGVLRAVIGAGLYLMLVGVFGLALGALIRSTAGGIATLFGALLVLPIIVNFLPGDWSTNINKYLPGSAGQSIMNVVHDSDSLSPWVGFAVFCGYVVIALAAAGVLLVRRDA